MKFSNRSFPVLEKLSTKSLGAVSYHEIDEQEITKHLTDKPVYELWKIGNDKFNSNKMYITAPILEALGMCHGKLWESDVYKNIGQDSGTLLLSKYQICYYFNNNPNDDFFCYYIFDKNILLGYAIINGLFNNENYGGFCFLSKTISDLPEAPEVDYCKDWALFIMEVLVFIKHTEPTTHILPPNRKLHSQLCKYKNETNANITVIDKCWITDLVKSDAFKVRGHYRWQACGAAFKERKLIWVADFEKDGYFRKHGRPDIDNETKAA